MATNLKPMPWFSQQHHGEALAPYCNIWIQTDLSRRKSFDLMRKVECLGVGISERKRLFLRCCKNGDFGNGWNWMSETEEFVKIMREARPYFQAHKGNTFVLILSAEIVDSPFLGSILEREGFKEKNDNKQRA
ncbi:unnamed protein product [Ilex paraguariensis]|uniref:Uncharacterized protein n=1 Tax=Ilex paraguariensis TaxID=185542 RepID=A0ABC8TSA7_9AQUA